VCAVLTTPTPQTHHSGYCRLNKRGAPWSRSSDRAAAMSLPHTRTPPQMRQDGVSEPSSVECLRIIFLLRGLRLDNASARQQVPREVLSLIASRSRRLRSRSE